jgi:hypothetical protein
MIVNKEFLKIASKTAFLGSAWIVEDHLRPKIGFLNVLGDSHAGYFRVIERQNPLAKTRIRVFSITGATASGLLNPNSRTKAQVAFKLILQLIKKRNIILFQLGEVDCGFLIWMKAKRAQTDPFNEAERCIERYMKFLEWTMKIGFSKIIVSTVPPPTIAHWESWRGPIAHLRRQVTASLEMRSRVTSYFNAQLRDGAERLDYLFLDVEDQYCDPDTKLVRRALVNEDNHEIHLNSERASRILKTALLKNGCH